MGESRQRHTRGAAVMLLWILCCVFLAAQESVCESARCFQHFDTQTGRCGQLLGEAEVDHCCMNPHYGYQGNDSVCHSCRPASWSEWSAWGACTVSCLEGVQQRRRFCFGIGLCKDPKGLGDLQTKSCQERDCCPKPAGWSEWGSWQACSVSCSSGHRQRERTCSSPPPNCGGPGCSGPSKETSACHTGKVCPVHGGWSAWGPWEPCDGTCVREGSEPPRRHSARYCTNPAPSIDPPGQPCPESGHRWEYCKGLPFCPVHGGWGPWGEYSRCSVTCGLGAQVKWRVCDSPAPKHGGHACPGEATSTKICNTHQHCPVDGQWSEWGEWSGCNRSGKNIRCSTYSAGTQRRARTCEHREWEGKHCSGDIVETRPCYDIEKCRMRGNYSDWGDWGLCKPSCGSEAQKSRSRECVMDISQYTNLKVGPKGELAHFAGKPFLLCPRMDKSQITQSTPCRNVPPCTGPDEAQEP